MTTTNSHQNTLSRPVKTVNDSRTEQVQILSLGTLNGYSRLFGGQLMEWIDIVAAVVARRHSNCNVTTAAVDSLDFNDAAYANDTIVLQGYITRVGNTSMDVCVKTYVEHLSGTRRLINTAYLVMVALDEKERPTTVPRLKIETEEEQLEYEAALRSMQIRNSRRRQQNDK